MFILGKKLLKSNILFFLIIGIISITAEIYLMQPILQLGLAHDDWILTTRYDMIGPNPINNFLTFYKNFGPYTATDGLYITVLHHLFNENYKYYHYVNIFIKSLAILALFPCIFLLFRNRLLAALTTILYATSYSATASFELSSKGTNYLATVVMLIYFMIYHTLVTKYPKSVFWHILMLLSFWGTILISASRMYPLLLIPCFIELFLLTKNSFQNYKSVLIRLVINYLPGLLIFVLIPNQILYPITRKPEFLMRLAVGDWQVLLTPLTGLGYILLPTKYLFSALGVPILTDMLNFIRTIFPYFFTFTILILLLSYKRIRISRIFLVCYTLIFLSITIIIYLLTAKHPAEYGTVGEALVGIFMTAIAISSLWFYLRSKNKDLLLTALAAGPIISLWFLISTWYLANLHLSFRSIHSYLTVPTIGVCLWLATLIIFFSQVIKRRFPRFELSWNIPLISIIIGGILIINYQEIRDYWNGRLNNGWAAATQDQLYKQTINLLAKHNFKINKPTLILLDGSRDPANAETYEQGFSSHFFYRIHYIGKNLEDGCIVILPGDINLLQKILIRKNNLLIYQKDYVCLSKLSRDFIYKSYLTDPLIPEQFYAFRLENKKVIDITDEVLIKIPGD